MRLSPLVGFFSTALAWVKESKLNLPWYLFDTETWVPVAEEEEGGRGGRDLRFAVKPSRRSPRDLPKTGVQGTRDFHLWLHR